MHQNKRLIVVVFVGAREQFDPIANWYRITVIEVDNSWKFQKVIMNTQPPSFIQK